MRRGERFGRFERRGATRLLHALSALLFALSILTQLASPAGAAVSHGDHWFCAKTIANPTAADRTNSTDGRTSAALDHCDHCAIGQAPTLPVAIVEEHELRRMEACATLHSSRTDPDGRQPTNPSLARAPPAFS